MQTGKQVFQESPTLVSSKQHVSPFSCSHKKLAKLTIQPNWKRTRKKEKNTVPISEMETLVLLLLGLLYTSEYICTMQSWKRACFQNNSTICEHFLNLMVQSCLLFAFGISFYYYSHSHSRNTPVLQKMVKLDLSCR